MRLKAARKPAAPADITTTAAITVTADASREGGSKR